MAKRVSRTALDWTKFLENTMKQDKPGFIALKAKQDAYIQSVRMQPDALPALDFAAYKARAGPALASVVADFESKYKALTIPYPKDAENQVSAIEAQRKESHAEVARETQASKLRIESHKEVQARWAKVIPFEHMCPEEKLDMLPHHPAFNLEKPETFGFHYGFSDKMVEMNSDFKTVSVPFWDEMH